jgi:hypothetical protein
LFRTLGLLVLGVFMVNAESGYNEQAMGMPIALWSLMFYACVILLWNVYTFESNVLRWVLRGTGLVLLMVLAFLYRGGTDGSQTLTPQWWGILGLIGWSYLITCIIYQLAGGRLLLALSGLAVCIVLYITAKSGEAESSPAVAWISGQTGHVIHTAIALCGIIVSLIFFDQQKKQNERIRFLLAIVFAGILFGTGYILRPYYTISKIYATPTWALYSAAVCSLIFTFLYWLIDLRKVNGWTAFFKPAASNPLLTYIIPFIVYALLQLLHIHWPDVFYQGVAGIVWSAVFAVVVMAIVIGLNKLKIRLQL